MMGKIWNVCIPIMKQKNISRFFRLDFCMRILIAFQPALALPVFLNLMLTAYESNEYKKMITYVILWLAFGIFFLVARYWFDIVVNGKFYYKLIEKLRDICIKEIYDKKQDIDANQYYTYLCNEVEVFSLILFRIARLVAVFLVALGFFLWCIHISPGMTVLVMLGGMISVWLGNRKSSKLNSLNQEIFEQKSRLNNTLRNLFIGTEEYLVKGKYQKLKQDYERKLAEYNKKVCRNTKEASKCSNLISLIDCVIYIMLIGYCYYFLVEKSPAVILTMISGYHTMKGYINELNTTWMMIVENSYVIDQYQELTESGKPADDNRTVEKEHAIEIYDLYYEVEETKILNHINLFINKGEKVALVGENGAGKSTLLKCILKLIQPTSGEIRLKRSFACSYIPVCPQLFPVSINENIRYALGNNKENVQEAIEAADVIKIDSISLEDELGDGDENLSGGAAQRVAIARAFAMEDYQILIADEPTANLDIYTERKVMSEILKRADTLIYTTHNPMLVPLADKVYVLKDGRIAAYGTPKEVCFLQVYKEWEKSVREEKMQ